MALKRPLDDPLDETVFRSEEMLMRAGGVHDNSILFYFGESPFFDKTSNNGVYYTQAALNPALHPTLQTRAAFEAELDKRVGQEYRIAEKPAETGPGMGTGVWVIRRQDREGSGKVNVRESFFVVGERVYQAPSAADVLGCSLLSITTSLNKFMSKAATLPDFSPSQGYTYPVPESAKSKFSDLGQRSKETTPMPDTQTSTKSTVSTQTDEYISNQLLADTIGISLRYGDEYMDEVPVTGQPGEFRLSTKKQDNTKLAVPAIPKAGGTPKPDSLPALKTDVPPALQRKGSKVEKSPKTPGGGPPKPKRRKSKVNVSTPGGTSPTM